MFNSLQNKKNNTMKALKLNINKILKALLIVVAAFQFNSGLFAQKSFRNNDLKSITANIFRSSEEIILAIRTSAEKRAFLEEEILLEDWMTNLDGWMKKMDTASSKTVSKENTVIMETEMELIDESLEMEDWMLDSNWLEKESFEEEDLKLEEWMKYPKNWNNQQSS